MAGTAYEVRGVSSSADPARVRAAYRELAMRFHPDHWAEADPQTRAEAELRMKQINAAYSSLRMKAPREQATGSRPASRSSPAPPRPPRPDVDRTRNGSQWTGEHVCGACQTPYPIEEALCPRCFWPNRPYEVRRRRGDSEDLGVFGLIAVLGLFVLPGLVAGLGPYVGFFFVPAAVAVWVAVQLRRLV